MTAAQDSRAQFEAQFKHLDLTQEPDAWGQPKYKHDAISLAWEAWQASRAALSAEPGGVPQGWRIVPEEPTREMIWSCKGRFIPRIALPFFTAGYKTMLAAAPQPAAQERKPLTDAQIEKLREKTFSTSNPFCPCDSKTMRKAVQAAERAHGIAGQHSM